MRDKIPNGPYCYSSKSDKQYDVSSEVIPCPFYSRIKCSDIPTQLQDDMDKEFPNEYVGWCKFIQSEIDDQCKSCGINVDYRK